MASEKIFALLVRYSIKILILITGGRDESVSFHNTDPVIYGVRV